MRVHTAMNRGFVSKRVSRVADALIQRCKALLIERFPGIGKRDVTDYRIIEEALRLYYAYLKGLIPREVVERALREVSKEVG